MEFSLGENIIVWQKYNPVELSMMKPQAFGNYTKNYVINEFLRKFIQIYTVYKRGELFEETYKAVVKDYLSRVE